MKPKHVWALFLGIFLIANGTVILKIDRTITLQSKAGSFLEIDPGSILMIHFGDMMFDRGVRRAMADGIAPLAKISEVTQGLSAKADFMIGNLEGPITAHEPCVEKAYSFKFDPELAGQLKLAGFTDFNLANNHSLDCYERGFLDTQKHLRDSGLGYFGGVRLEDSYRRYERNGQKLALIGIDETIQPIAMTEFYFLIQELAAENDFVVVHIHWGDEYEKTPAERQVTIGRKLIDSGANIIIGHHPHVTEPIEIYKSGVIFYSLGNFIFDQITVEQNTGFGVVMELTNQEWGFRLLPYSIKRGQPNRMTKNREMTYCKKLVADLLNSKAETCSFSIKR